MNSRAYDALIKAIQLGDAAIVKRLKMLTPTVEQRDILHYAVQFGNSSIVSELLNSNWINEINEFDDVSFTPLIWAARNNHKETVKLLLEAGANINGYDSARIGNTVLREVVGESDTELVKLLLSYGADPSIRGWMQMNALDKAMERYKNSSTAESEKIIQMLQQV